jgi:hypothetical protein
MLTVNAVQPPQIDESTLVSMQQHMAQQAAFAQIPDVVKRVSNLLYFLDLICYRYSIVHRALSSSCA